MRKLTPINLNGSSSKAEMEQSRSLVVRTNSASNVPDDHPKVERGPELAEQLNEETKQKYVKGRSEVASSYQLDLLISHR